MEIEIDIDYVFTFGRNKGNSVREILITEHGNYIVWMIQNFSDLLFSPKFLEDVVNVYPRFKINESDYDLLHNIIRNYKLKYKDAYHGSNFENYLEDKSYLKWLNLSEKEIELRMGYYRQRLREIVENAISRARMKTNSEKNGEII